MKVLIVANQNLIHNSVQLGNVENAEIDHCFNLTDAKVGLLEVEYDIIFCEYQLADGKGVDLIRWARRRNMTGSFLIVDSSVSEYQTINSFSLGEIGIVPAQKPVRLCQFVKS